MRVVRFGERACDGEDDPTGARGVGGEEGGEEDVGAGEGVDEPERAFPDRANEDVGDAASEAGFEDASAQKEGGENEPDEGFGVSAERFCRREGAGDGDGDHAEEDDGAGRNRSEDGSDDSGGEDGEESPGLGGHSGGGACGEDCREGGEDGSPSEEGVHGREYIDRSGVSP